MKTFRLLMSERCFRFKPEALGDHAPAAKGVYEFVTFDADKKAKVVYVGLALDKDIRTRLAEHMTGAAEPTAAKLLGAYDNMYFDFVARADVESDADWVDIAAALRAKHSPELNAEDDIVPTGRHPQVAVDEVDVWVN